MKRSRNFRTGIALAAALAFVATVGAAARTAVPIDEKKVEDITKAVTPSVVKIEVRNGIRRVATGVVLDKEGSIVTTALISPHDEAIEVVTADGRRLKAEFKGFDTQTQLALVQVKEKGLAPLAQARPGDLKPGAWIGVVGLSPENTPSVTQGIVSSVAADRIRLNVWVVPGASGSPVVNAEGRMVGLLRGAYADDMPVVFEFRERQVVGSGTVVSRAEAPSSGMALAVPIDVVASVAADLKKSGKVQRGWLGVTVVENEGKVVIDAIDAKSPAELAKLKSGDVLLKVDGRDVTAGPVLSSEIRSRKPGQDVTIRIERDGKPQDVKVKLGEFTEVQAKQELELNFPQFFNPRFPAPAQPRVAPQMPREPINPRGRTAPRPNFVWESRKFIGVTLQALTKELGEYFGVKDATGLLVAQVEDESPAKKAGLKVGDVILKAAGQAVEDPADLSDMIQRLKKGDKIKLDILRDKKATMVEVEVGEQESGPEAGSFERFNWSNGDFGAVEENLRRLNESPRLGQLMRDARGSIKL